MTTATGQLTDDQITALITPQNPALLAQSPDQQEVQEPENAAQAGPPKKKQKKNKNKGGANTNKNKYEATKPFDAHLPSAVKLADLKNFQFIPRKVEMEQVTRTVKLSSSNNAPLTKVEAPTPKVPPIAENSVTAPLTPANGDVSSSTNVTVHAQDSTKAKDDKENKDPTKQTIIEFRPKPDPTIRGSKGYWKALKDYNQFHQTRRSVQFVIPIGPKSPKILLLSSKKNSKDYVVPGGALKHDEDELEGVKRVWYDIFKDESGEVTDITTDVIFKEVIGTWYRPDLKVNVYPYDPKLTICKEIIKVYLVELPKSGKMTFNGVYESLKPVHLQDLYDLGDPEIKNIPVFLSNYKFEDLR